MLVPATHDDNARRRSILFVPQRFYSALFFYKRPTTAAIEPHEFGQPAQRARLTGLICICEGLPQWGIL